MSVWNMRKGILFDNGPAGEGIQSNPTPECEVSDTECYDS